MRTTEDITTALNDLLRGELAAAESYDLALAHVDREGASPGRDALRAELGRIRDEHRETAVSLWQLVEQHGGTAAESAGVWGALARLVEGTASIFGKGAALRALRDGEERGVAIYERALASDDLPPDACSLVRDLVLPRQRRHCEAVARLAAHGS